MKPEQHDQFKDIDKILLTEDEIKQMVEKVGAKISADYQNHEGKLLLLGILRGAVVFMTDLMRSLTIPAEIDFMCVSSYGSSTHSSGQLNIKFDIKRDDIPDCDILIVEDITDSGRTLTYLTHYLSEKGAKSVKTCAFFDKPSRREVEFTPDYTCFEIPDEFIVGYGLDYDQKYRTLPFVGVLKPEIYENN